MKSYDKKINQLIAMYVRAEKNLVNTISQKKYKGQVTDFYEAMLKQVKLQLMQLQAKSVVYSKDIVNDLYLEAYYNSLKNLGISNIGDGFAQLHTDAIELLSDNIINNFAEVNNQVGRRIEDTIRDIGLTNTQMKFATGQTIRQLQNELIDNLVNTGLGGITDKRGRVIPFTTYAELLARSIVAETQNTSVMNVAKEHKKDLVKMTKHNTACTVCQEYEGKIYSISGKSEKYPALKSIPGFNKGYNNIHPRCRHRISVYIEKYSDEYIKNQGKAERKIKRKTKENNKATSWHDYEYVNKEFKSKNEMKKYLKDKHDIKFGDSTKQPMDQGLMSDCINWLDKFTNRFSDFNKINPVKLPAIKNKAAGMGRSVGYYKHYINQPEAIELALNSAYFGNKEYLEKYIERIKKSKWGVANATPIKTFVHEYGHHVGNSMNWITKEKYKGNRIGLYRDWEDEIIGETIKEYNKRNNTNYKRSDLKDIVSEYGTTSNKELFAEAFAEYFQGENPREFAQIFGEKVEKALLNLKEV